MREHVGKKCNTGYSVEYETVTTLSTKRSAPPRERVKERYRRR